MASAENLPILFVDNIGGTVWTQFPRRADFGNGPPHKMTTGRQYFEAPRPITGGPKIFGGDKPQAFIAREFEVQYHIVFQPPVFLAPTTAGGPLVGTHVTVGGGVAATGMSQPRALPCIKI